MRSGMIGRDERDASFARATKAPTHYIPPFTRVNGRQQQAVCGAWVVEREFSLEPSCPACGAWLERTADEDAETAKALGLADKFVGGVDDGKA